MSDAERANGGKEERGADGPEPGDEAAAPPPPRRSGKALRALRTALVSLVLLAILGGFVGTLFFLYERSKGPPPVVKTEKAAVSDIVRKAVATGSIVPRREVLIKPRVSGILKTIHVVAGQLIKEGDLIAEVTIIPDVVALTRAEGQVRSANISLKHATLELERAKRLREGGLLSELDLSSRQLDRDIKAAEVAAANEGLTVAREGAIARSDKSSNTQIRATVAGTVLDVPVIQGASVIEANNFNEGTTIAIIADMSDMIFLGTVDEADVGKISTGMDASIQIGAIENRTFDGKLEFIASKGKLVDGAIQFEVRAALAPVQGVTIRAGYSANAGIVLEKRTQTLALNEKLVSFEGDKPYVEVKVAVDRFERRNIEVGISDGIKIEVKSGVAANDEIKVPEANAGKK
ncbi:efflux RND transporter periplasmic adaptor subunit [Polyangium sp. 6x1]|uniref:efflux RND transporter periplasmic adaptor subunit n=1 Tax=Polyangium sp. 6x1 TaxID=3042689 RepID=UPI00248263C5|nr:efflux RND transporter periplasmic adaptor subunit [Polyangium sp. 6x1]MDI1450928.1 efflux RND transporter periplasmic adaptor subunit [Polyangium sp. 6x1]